VSQGAFSDRLIDAIRQAGAPTCVGLDPVLDKLPAVLRSREDPVDAIQEFCSGVLDAVAGVCPVVKFQSACFERYGPAGIEALRDLTRAAHQRELAVVLDAKRGDIGVTAEHYRYAAFGGDRGGPSHGADAMTVSGYLGMDTVESFTSPGHGLFVLVRTSNPGSDGVQSLKLADGRTVAEMMADHVAALGAKHLGSHGYSDLGAVVGATKAQDGRALRARMPRQIFLVPGYGAQGGTADDIRALLDGRPECGGGVLVTASRSVIYAFDAADAAWAKSIKRAALKFTDEIRAVVA
jgi:orotidine-5'-phosphate decarboxylase